MADTTPTAAAEASRFAIRLPHWGWCLLLVVVLVITGIGLSIWMPYSRESQIVPQLEGLGAKVERKTRGPDWVEHLVPKQAYPELLSAA